MEDFITFLKEAKTFKKTAGASRLNDWRRRAEAGQRR